MLCCAANFIQELHKEHSAATKLETVLVLIKCA